jgi:methionyl-tRNA formyltransferase
MRIVIITGQLPHHKNLCARIDREFPVAAVFHPNLDTRTFPKTFKKFMKEVSQNGFIYTSLRILGKKLGWPLNSNYKEAESRYFAQEEEEYNKKLAAKSHCVKDINSEEVIELIKENKPDVVLCLGGPVYGKKLIDCCPLMLNWHSGISPIYNGSTTVEFAFSQGQLNFVGGTLMIVNKMVDGGNILAHYFPSIEAGDTPATLFMKTVKGAAFVYLDFLRDLQYKEKFVSVQQFKSFFYFRSRDWNLLHSLSVQRLLKSGICSKMARDEDVIKYWRFGTAKKAKEKLNETVLARLGTI